MAMQTTTELVTVAKATKWLNENHTNRALREGVAERYAEDMRNNQWTTCVAPIVFYEDGELADGQHRLYAIVLSEKPQSFVIMRGLPRSAGLNIDTGLNRTIVDNARISGRDPHLSTTLVGVARGFVIGGPYVTRDGSRAQSWSMASTIAAVGQYREPCMWAVHNGPKSKFLRNKVTLSAIARAKHAGVDEAKLKRFCAVLESGLAAGAEEWAAVELRNYLLNKGPLASTSTLWVDTFKKVQNAIHYFVRGKTLKVIKSVADEVYPLREPVVSKKTKVKK